MLKVLVDCKSKDFFYRACSDCEWFYFYASFKIIFLLCLRMFSGLF